MKHIKICSIFCENFISEAWIERVRKIPLIMLKWTSGLSVGIVVGFLTCYVCLIITKLQQFDWKIVTSLFALLGAIGGGLLVYTEKLMSIALKKVEYHLKEREFEGKSATAEKICEKLAIDLVPLLNEKVFNSDTIYQIRASHYFEEKKCLAKNYIKFLQKRQLALIDNEKLNKNNTEEIIVILDSGTTIAQIFDQLGRDAVIPDKKNPFVDKESKQVADSHWTNNKYIKFYTNSIRGVLCLFKYRDQSSRYSEIPFNINIFSGEILSPYEAIADISTVKSILELKKAGRYIIFVTTGNYLIFNAKNKMLLPIARAGFHPHVKAAGFHVANEVHILAPLGKILMNSPHKRREKETIQQTLDRFNKSLGYSLDNKDESMRNYSLISPEILINNTNIKDTISKQHQDAIKRDAIVKWIRKSILITTSRMNDQHKEYWLSNHSAVIRNSLYDQFDPESTVLPNESNSSFIQHYPFDGVSYSLNEQVEQEIPRKDLRRKEILSNFFEVPERD